MVKQRFPTVIIGANEWVGLPALGIGRLRARVDTGAKTSALHVGDMQTFRKGRYDWVRFQVVRGSRRSPRLVDCEARISDIRNVRNTSGRMEQRLCIETVIQLGYESWQTEITLTNRDKMRYRMLLGRSAISHHALVDPGRRYLHGYPATP